jgi:hypothetical protein
VNTKTPAQVTHDPCSLIGQIFAGGSWYVEKEKQEKQEPSRLENGIVTPKGVLLLAKCHASATLEGF